MGQPKDLLIQHPFNQMISTKTPLLLYKSLRPHRQFVIHREGKRLIAINKSKMTPISPTQRELINHFDGNHTLSAIRESFGQEALDWIGLLNREGFISWTEK